MDVAGKRARIIPSLVNVVAVWIQDGGDDVDVGLELSPLPGTIDDEHFPQTHQDTSTLNKEVGVFHVIRG